MSSQPENDPIDPYPASPSDPQWPSASLESGPAAPWPYPSARDTIENRPAPAQSEDPPLFAYWEQASLPRTVRAPHFGHLLLLVGLSLFGVLCAGMVTQAALHYRLYGVSTVAAAMNDIHYTLGSELVLYLCTFAACLPVFPLFWHKSFMAGVQWNSATALKLRRRLGLAALLCFVFALINGLFLPGPQNAPIDQIVRERGAAWLLFGFGITFAPFFEEIAFRGFLLPALCTAWDWAVERATGRLPLPLDETGQPRWSLFAMFVGSIATSIPFALMHAEQIAHAAGPLLMLACVSLVLCAVRLSTRSLAASVLVHACYNFLLFFFMLLGTGGFRHMEKM